MMTALQAYLEDMGGFKGTIFVQEVKDVPEGVQELVCICLSTVIFRYAGSLQMENIIQKITQPISVFGNLNEK